MMKLNCFECTITCYDSTGLEVGITELPAKDRREIANAIINGHTFGTFGSVVIQHDVLNELHPIFVHELQHACDMHRQAVLAREIEHDERAKSLSVNTLEEKEEEQDE